MPELPEVETVARQLDAAVSGKRIVRFLIRDEKLQALDAARLAGCRVSTVQRYGKQVVFELIPKGKRNPALWLAVHLRMTGRLTYTPHATQDDTKSQPRAVLMLDRDAVAFHDTRRFGTITLHGSIDDVLPVGVEPLSPALTWRKLAAMLSASTMPIKTWLLRQDRLVGIGNIYASEILFAARIHPSCPAQSLTAGEVKLLTRTVRRILRVATKHCGTTFSDFQDSRGEIGGYAQFLKVYGRAGQPCHVCSEEIVRATHAQRSTFFCPRCQQVDRC